MSNDIYRIVRTVRMSADVTSTGQTKHYTQRAELVHDLLRFQLEMDRYGNEPKSLVRRVLLDFWRTMFYGTDVSKKYPYTVSMSVERHVTKWDGTDASWVEVPWSYTKPSVTVAGVEFTK